MKLDARKDSARVDGVGGVTYAPATPATTSITARAHSSAKKSALSDKDKHAVALAKVRAAEYDRTHGTTTRVYTTLEYRESERISSAGKRETYTRTIVHIHTYRESAPVELVVESAPIPQSRGVTHGKITQDRARLAEIAARLAKYRD